MNAHPKKLILICYLIMVSGCNDERFDVTNYGIEKINLPHVAVKHLMSISGCDELYIRDSSSNIKSLSLECRIAGKTYGYDTELTKEDHNYSNHCFASAASFIKLNKNGSFAISESVSQKCSVTQSIKSLVTRSSRDSIMDYSYSDAISNMVCGIRQYSGLGDKNKPQFSGYSDNNIILEYFDVSDYSCKKL